LFPLLVLLFSRRPNPNIYIYTTTPRYLVVVALLFLSRVLSFQSALVYVFLCSKMFHFSSISFPLKRVYTSSANNTTTTKEYYTQDGDNNNAHNTNNRYTVALKL